MTTTIDVCQVVLICHWDGLSETPTQIGLQTDGARVASVCTCSGRKYCRYSTPPGAAVMDRSEDRCEVDDLSQQLLFNPLKPELNPICYLLALLGAHHFLHVSRIRVKLLTFRLLMSYIYIYGAPILDVSRSHTTTQHSR